MKKLSKHMMIRLKNSSTSTKLSSLRKKIQSKSVLKEKRKEVIMNTEKLT